MQHSLFSNQTPHKMVRHAKMKDVTTAIIHLLLDGL